MREQVVYWYEQRLTVSTTKYLKSTGERHWHYQYTWYDLLWTVGRSALCQQGSAFAHCRDENTNMQVALYGWSCCVCGIAVLLPPFMNTYWQMLCICIVFGVTVSSNYSLSTVLIAHLMPLDSFIGGYGAVSLAEGVGMLVGPALAGGRKNYPREHLFSCFQATCTIGLAPTRPRSCWAALA